MCWRRCKAAAGQDRPDLEGLHREGQARQADRRDRRPGEDRLSRRRPRQPSALADKVRGLLDGHHAARGPPRQRSRGDPVHLGFGRNAEGRGAFPPQHSRQCGAGAGAGRRQCRRQGVQRAAGVPFLRPDRRPDDAAARRHSGLSLSLAAALPHRARTDLPDQRDHPVRHRHVPRRLCALRPCLRLPHAAPGAGRRRSGEGAHAAGLHGALRHAHSRRLWRHRDRAGAGDEHADGQHARARSDGCRR